VVLRYSQGQLHIYRGKKEFRNLDCSDSLAISRNFQWAGRLKRSCGWEGIKNVSHGSIMMIARTALQVSEYDMRGCIQKFPD